MASNFVDRRKNGGTTRRWLIALTIFYGIVTFIYAGGTVYTLIVGNVYEPLGDFSVQRITNRIPGIEGPAVYLDETINVTATKCNNTREPVGTTGVVVIVRRNAGNLREYYTMAQGAGIREPGCSHFLYHNPIPAGVGPGLWRLEGQETARSGSYTQVKVYVSEDFLIVARPK